MTLSIVVFVVWLTAAESYAQSTQVPVRPSSQSPGRFQLVPEPGGTIFLLDTATGRVWRNSYVTPSDSDVKASVDKTIALQEASNGRSFSEAERKALFDKLSIERKDELQKLKNPCNGLTICFVEVDRVRLMPNGGFSSEIVGAK